VAHRLELVHGDLLGPVMPSTPSGNTYIFLLVDDLHMYMWVSLMSNKDQALASFVAFESWAEAESGRKIRTLHTNHGGEFTTGVFVEHACRREYTVT
jgi:hypothetical protein